MPLQLTITNAGRAAIVDQGAGGFRAVRIAQVGVSATAVTGDPAASALPGEVKRIDTLSGEASASDVIHLTVTDETMATYTIRSFALYLTDGTLFALYGQAQPIVEKSGQAVLLLSIDVELVGIPAASITFGNAAFINPPATTERRGVVELATDAEAAAMEDGLRALTPKGASAIMTASIIKQRLGYTPINPDPESGGVQYYRHGFFRFTSDHDTGARDGVLGNTLHVTSDATNGGATMTFHRLGTYAINMGLDSDNVFRIGGSSARASLFALADSGTLLLAGSNVWTSGNDGSGSGLDADLLDGREGTYYADIPSRLGYTPINPSPAAGGIQYYRNGFFRFTSSRDTGARDGLVGNTLHVTSDATNGGATMTFHRLGTYAINMGLDSDNVFRIGGSSARASLFALTDEGNLSLAGNAVWHAGNDGAGSGLDADLLDGRQASDFQLKSEATAGHNARGWWERRPNGIIEQWGTVPAAAVTAIAFPIDFTDADSIVVVPVAGGDTGTIAGLVWTQRTTNGCVVALTYADGSPANISVVHWRAIGR